MAIRLRTTLKTTISSLIISDSLIISCHITFVSLVIHGLNSFLEVAAIVRYKLARRSVRVVIDLLLLERYGRLTARR